MKKRSNKGFTLVELIVILVILAIISALLIPTLMGYIEQARAKKYLPNAKSCYDAAQAMFSKQYGLQETPALGTPVVGGAHDYTDSSTKNGDQDISQTQFAKDVLRLAGMPDGKPYFFMVAVGSNVGGTTASEASDKDKYTVYYACYVENPDSQAWYYYNGEWTVSNPRYNNSSSIFTDRNVIKKTGIRIQYYVIANDTGLSVQGDLWTWLKSMK
ncbi:MAG: prepilin-type N-terminal cleavage/methylation domain-containing protein [Lachnospiraceae bacterium]|nr:prepilin-type N-terminal cleavage/methylation domain-containing protein [Lachnospiraceae bacterium]